VTRAPDATTTSGFVGSDLGFAVCGRWRGLALGIALRAGVDVVLAPPTIGYDVAGDFVSEHVLWNLQPMTAVVAEIASD
jgi:hypothetical protein